MKKAFGNFFPPKKQEMSMTDQYKKWRELIFALKPESGGVASNEENRVFGILVDNIQFDKETKTLWAISQTAFASGESSLQSTVGMGIVGLGVSKGDEDISAASQQLVGIAQQLFTSAAKTTDYSLPELNVVRFFFLTTSGTYFIDSEVDKIERGDNRLFEMLKGFIYIRKFAQNIIAQGLKQNLSL
jgi:hypothetical protein